MRNCGWKFETLISDTGRGSSQKSKYVKMLIPTRFHFGISAVRGLVEEGGGGEASLRHKGQCCGREFGVKESATRHELRGR